MLIIIVLSFLLLSSCSLDNHIKSDVHLITVALNYKDDSELKGTLNDQRAVIEQFEYLSNCEKRNFYSHVFTQNRDSYTYKYHTNALIGDKIEVVNALSSHSFKIKLQEVFQTLNSKENDLIVFYYAGHGIKNKNSIQHGALILGSLNSEYSNYLYLSENQPLIYSLDELRSDLSQVPGNKLIVLDSCFSGNVIKDDYQEEDNFDLIQAFKDLFKFERVKNDLIWELSGARDDEYAYEKDETIDDLPHGAFTRVFLEALGYRFYIDQVEGPGIKDAMISFVEVHEYCNKMLKRKNQNPSISKSVRDLILFNLESSYLSL